jgi:hypothetical protein
MSSVEPKQPSNTCAITVLVAIMVEALSHC